MTEAMVVEAVQGVFLANTAGEWIAIALARAWIFWYVPLAAWLWFSGVKRKKHADGEILWAVGAALLTGEILSLAVLRLRPFLAESQVVALIPPPLTSSFPSLHTAVSVAATCILYSVDRRAGWLGIVVLAGVAVGRLAVGVHYPSDILGGIAVGFCSYLLVCWGHAAVRRRKRS